MKKRFEAWRDQNDNSITLTLAKNIEQQKYQEILSSDATFLYFIDADTWEEAMAVHYIKQGWKPYKPIGEPSNRPNNCGNVFYPESSGECPNCGPIC